MLRGGFGISYARLPSASVIRLQQRKGTVQKTIYFFGGGNPSALAAGPSSPGYLTQAPNLSGGASNVTFADPNLATPYTEQADLAVEQRIDSKTTFDITYMWNDGVKFLTRKDDNLKVAAIKRDPEIRALHIRNPAERHCQIVRTRSPAARAAKKSDDPRSRSP